jgi:hypothetical protein
MTLALISRSVPIFLIYAGSFILVLWVAVDALRRPSNELASRQKAAWVIGCAAGWLLLGILGACIALVYLVGPRRRMNSERR